MSTFLLWCGAWLTIGIILNMLMQYRWPNWNGTMDGSDGLPIGIPIVLWPIAVIVCTGVLLHNLCTGSYKAGLRRKERLRARERAAIDAQKEEAALIATLDRELGGGA